MLIEERIDFEAERNRLDGILSYPEDDEPSIALLFLSPHPHFGGTMDNNVVRILATSAAAEGAATLRFNYRGVGSSQIALETSESLYSHWEQMERQLRYDEILPDAQAALDALVNAIPTAPIALIGYSLGAIVAGMLASDPRVRGLAAIAPPIKRVGLEVFANYTKHKLIVAANSDFTFDRERFSLEYESLPEPKQFVVFAQCDHFFRRREHDLYGVVRAFINELAGGTALA